MGQKVNQTIFRAGASNYEYNQKYLEKNTEESSLILYINVGITNYIETLFTSYDILIHTCKLEYTQTSLNIILNFFDLNSKNDKLVFGNNKKKLISFLITNLLPISLNLYIKNKKINIKTKNLNKIFENPKTKKLIQKNVKSFKRILKNKSYKNLIKVMFITVLEKNSSKLLAKMISIYVNKHKKKHYFLFSILKKYFNILIYSKYSQIKGIKIYINGRINGAPRARSLKMQIGSVPLQSFESSVSYYNTTSYTQNGSFGIKVWVCEKL